MFSTNIKQKGRKGRRLTSRRRAGGILVGGTFGLFALLWSGLIVYVGLAARARDRADGCADLPSGGGQQAEGCDCFGGSGSSGSSILRPKAGADGAPVVA